MLIFCYNNYGDNMSWIDIRRKEDEIKFHEMKNLYRIPEKYRDASLIYFKNNIEAKIKLKSKKYIILKELIDDWNEIYEDMQYKFPRELGEELERNFSDENFVFGIHRTDLNIEQIKNEIFTKGLKNRSNEYTSTVQTFKSFPLMLREIIYCNNYKNSQGCVLLKLPKDCELPIYYMEDNNYYILNEYIYGYIKIDDNRVTKFILNPNYKNEHNYESQGLIYDEILENESKKKR